MVQRITMKSDPRNRGKEGPGARKQLKLIYSLMKRNDVDMIISTCDIDREGQVIGDTINYNLKTEKKVYRLLQKKWTPDEVLKGLQNIKPNSETKPLQDTGIERRFII